MHLARVLVKISLNGANYFRCMDFACKMTQIFLVLYSLFCLPRKYFILWLQQHSYPIRTMSLYVVDIMDHTNIYEIYVYVWVVLGLRDIKNNLLNLSWCSPGNRRLPLTKIIIPPEEDEAVSQWCWSSVWIDQMASG